MNLEKLPNNKCEGFVLLKKCEVRKTTTGKDYLDIIIADKDGEMSGKWWDYVPSSDLKSDIIVKVRGTVEEYRGKEQFRVELIRPAKDGDNYNLSDFVPVFDVDGEQLYSFMMGKVESITNDDLRRIVTKLVTDHHDDMVLAPAAIRMHHARKGGLMYHTMSIVAMAEQACAVYPTINRDLLLSGAILHDIAKTTEYDINELGNAVGYTFEGEMLGHLVQGAMFVAEAAKQLGIHSREAVMLEHMLLSHHGKPEYGAAVFPKFLEAIVLNMLDNLDATVYEVDDALTKVEQNAFSDRVRALDNRRLYNHSMSDYNHRVNFK